AAAVSSQDVSIPRIFIHPDYNRNQGGCLAVSARSPDSIPMKSGRGNLSGGVRPPTSRDGLAMTSLTITE
ncbi:MAG: hypothetical protein Q7K41_03295, partial [Dehalococcoidales bacterium]|nr:hypothetical protein [Dehalococcoidales bacterium]